MSPDTVKVDCRAIVEVFLSPFFQNQFLHMFLSPGFCPASFDAVADRIHAGMKA